MFCSRTVFRCFKAFERCADRITGAAGPFFVGMAVLLLGSGIFGFFEVIAPTLSFPLLSIPICLLIALNLGLHYYYVCTTPPGFVTNPRSNAGIHDAGIAVGELPGGIRITTARTTKCRKCGQIRPERAHHCRICQTCVLKYDHHCPWINQCVGIHNERHFVLFMFYLVLSGTCFAVLGYPKLLLALGIGVSYGTSFSGWEYYTPPVLFTLLFVLAAVMSFAVGIMLAFHLHTISKGETTVESQDFEVYQKWAGGRGENFVNSYDLGKMRNLKLFFGLYHSPSYTLFIPIRIRPYTDGWSWARKPGAEELRINGDMLTDEDEDEIQQQP